MYANIIDKKILFITCKLASWAENCYFYIFMAFDLVGRPFIIDKFTTNDIFCWSLTLSKKK